MVLFPSWIPAISAPRRAQVLMVADHKTKRPLHLGQRMERSRMAVSPFDGANRIRFKGSPDFRLRNSDCGLEEPVFFTKSALRNQQSQIRGTLSRYRGSPETLFYFQATN